MVKRLIGLACALGALFAAVPASATMNYVFVGSFTGKVTTDLSTTPVTQDFSDLPLAFAGTSDGSAATLDTSLTTLLGADVYAYSLTGLLISDLSDTVFLTGSGYDFIVAPTKKLIGFETPTGLLFTVKLPSRYDGTSDYAPSGYSDIKDSDRVAIGRGRNKFKLKLNHVDDSTGGAFLAFDTPVPESATWAMFILGFGGIGFVMRRRQTDRLLAA